MIQKNNKESHNILRTSRFIVASALALKNGFYHKYIRHSDATSIFACFLRFTNSSFLNLSIFIYLLNVFILLDFYPVLSANGLRVGYESPATNQVGGQVMPVSPHEIQMSTLLVHCKMTVQNNLIYIFIFKVFILVNSVCDCDPPLSISFPHPYQF